MRQISYDELKVIAKDVAHVIRDKHTDYELVAVARGGLTFAQLVAYHLAKPLHFFIPKDHALLSAYPLPYPSHVIFLEDVIAEGRTFRLLDNYAAHHNMRSWEMIPVVLDEMAPQDIQDRVNTYGIRTSDWIVFPHEEVEKTVEGDRGLFRAGTSMNSKF